MFYMTATKQNITHIGIDGGDFYPEDEVKSGIQRLVKSFLNSLSAKKSKQKSGFIIFLMIIKYPVSQGQLPIIMYQNVYSPLFSSFSYGT